MSFKNLKIKNSYESTGDNEQLLNEFYLPVLKESVEYCRVAGFFSSSSLIVASEGIEGLLKNNGKMKLLISPNLSEDDYEILLKSNDNKLDENISCFNGFDIEDFPKNDRLKALSWLLANNRLEIKIVVNKKSYDSLFHQKVGICYDNENNIISFSGSINETANAWLSNIEEFKTFKSWIEGQRDYLLEDLKKFNAFWKNEREDCAIVYDLPESIKQKIIKVKPNDLKDLQIMKDYKENNESKNILSLFDHQKKAIEMWKSNNYSLLIEMATGTGKTRTAIGCFLELKDKLENFLVIVSTPQNTLSRQWKNDVSAMEIKFDKDVIVDGSVTNWKNVLDNLLMDLNLNYIKNAIIYTTHDTSSSLEFINRIKDTKRNIKIMLICDEVHAIGSEKRKNALLDVYDYRVGLSATPERMFDEKGTSLIRDYFGNKSFEFTINDALNTINPITGKPFLNPFKYYPHFVELTENELILYKDFSRKISIEYNKDEVDDNKISKLLIERSKIIKNAENKFLELENIINNMISNGGVKDTLIFSTEKQLNEIMTMLSNKRISRCKVTEEESTSKIVGVNNNTEREEIINKFRNGDLQVLIGIKCLDEGIDIKNARIAILLANTINPREYIQRIGRVIRVNENKDISIIHDFIVKTYDEKSDFDKILQKEAKRAMLISADAINYSEVKEIFKVNGVVVNGD